MKCIHLFYVELLLQYCKTLAISHSSFRQLDQEVALGQQT